MSWISNRGLIFIPRPYPRWQVKMTRKDNTVDDVTDNALSFEFNKVATESIGTFEIEIDNNDGNLTDKYKGGETVELLVDAGATPSTTRFKGIIEEVRKKFKSNKGNTLIIKGIHLSGIILDITVTKSHTAKSPDFILKDLIDTYLTGFTYNNVNSSTESIDVSWNHKPFLDAVIELATAADFDFYVDDDKDFHFFQRGSILNTIDAIVQQDNFRDMQGILEDTLDIKNRVIVYGKDKNGLVIIETAEDIDSQNSLNVKEKIIRDTDISTSKEAKDKAHAELSRLKLQQTKGEVKSLGLPDINPGELIWVSVPMQGVHRKFIITKLNWKFGEDGFETEIDVQKEPSRVPQILKKQFIKDIEQEDIDNPNEMRFSFNLDFSNDDDVSIHSGTDTDSGFLKISSGTTGTMTSKTKTHTDNITKTELRVSGQDLDSSSFQVSTDAGATFDTITVNTIHNMTNPGKFLILKVKLTSDSDNTFPKLDSAVVLFKV